MAVKIRLTRLGAKKAPFYRIVATDSRKARDGQYLEQIGYYNPIKDPAEVKIDAEIAKKWLNVGAQPTETVRSLFVKEGIIERK
ncbi:MAG: 30S ribosomal protein S16 [Clostridia bacterium]